MDDLSAMAPRSRDDRRHVRNTVAPVPQPIVPPSDVNGEKAQVLAAAEVAVIDEG